MQGGAGRPGFKVEQRGRGRSPRRAAQLEENMRAAGRSVMHLDADPLGERHGRFASSERRDEPIFTTRGMRTRYRLLLLRQRAKQISGLAVEPSWPISIKGRRIATYTAGFAYLDHERGDRSVIEHVETADDPLPQVEVGRLLRRIAEALHDLRIEEVVL